MENKDLLDKITPDDDVTENELPLPLYEVPKQPMTALEFEIAEDGEENDELEPAEDELDDEAEEDAEDNIDEDEDYDDDSSDDTLKDEFLIPDKYKTDPAYDTQSFLSTPGALRPTYLPRFTEISDTYRMQDDPRPRPSATNPGTLCIDDESADVDREATSESFEDREIEKVVVVSGVSTTKESVDESITILKFSTPDMPDEEMPEASEETAIEVENTADESAEEAFEITVIPEEVPRAPEEFMPAPEAEPEEPEEPEIIEEPKEEKPKVIPDPDFGGEVQVYQHEDYLPVEPLGANEPIAKDKKSKEYTAPVQRDSIKDKFLDTLMSIKVRLVCAAILLVTVLMMNVSGLLGGNPLESLGLGSVPNAKAFMDMYVAICMFLLAIPEMVNVVRLLFKKTFTPEIFVLAMLPVVVANCLIVAFNGETSYMTLVSLYGLQCFFTIFSAYIRTDADFIAFKNVSKNIGKNVLDKRFTRELPRENLALDGAIDEYNSKTARMFRTVFVSGFFKRSRVNCENSSNVLMMLGISAGASLVSALAAFFIDGFDVVSASQAFAMVFMISLPAFSVLVHKLPYKISAKTAEKFDEGAYIGESSVYESADVDVVTYDDTEIFGIEDVKVRVHVYGQISNTPKAMKQMYSLFTVVGGPLEYVFASSLDRKCAPATDIVIEDDGISGTMDGHRIHAGTEEYMVRNGIRIPDNNHKSGSSSDSNRIMYCAEDDVVYAKFTVRYSFSEEFTMLLPELKEKKIVPLIYTRDPNITNDLLKMLTMGEDIIRVMRKYVPKSEEENTYRHIDSGLVTYGDKLNAINMVLLAKKYTSLQSSLAVMELVTMIIGAAVAAIVAIGKLTVIPEIAFVVWQLVWCLVLLIRSKLNLKGNSIRYDDEGKRTDA